MAATATRSRSSSKSVSKKSSSSSSDRRGPQLQIRYPRVMKPNQVASLVVELPKQKRKKGDEEDVESSGLVVVRPIIPGALVTPAEQRLELEPGNQILFYVTPLARGRLPRPHLDVFAPNQPPEAIPLSMKSKTQRLALVLFLLAFLVPMLLVSYTKGKLRPGGVTYPHKDVFIEPLKKDLPPIPIFNRTATFLPDDALGIDWKTWTFADTVGELWGLGYNEVSGVMNDKDQKYTWLPSAIGAGFLFLTFLAWMFNKPRKKLLKRTLKLELAGAGASGAAATLEPM